MGGDELPAARPEHRRVRRAAGEPDALAGAARLHGRSGEDASHLHTGRRDSLRNARHSARQQARELLRLTMRQARAGGYRRDFPHGVMFHRFHASDTASAWQGALSPAQFEAILLFVGIENILSPRDWMSRLQEGTLEPQHRCVTFDDGLRSQADHALPVLERFGLQAFWFVYSCVSDGIPVKSEVYSFVAGACGGMPGLIEEFLQRCPPGFQEQLRSPAFAAYEARVRAAHPFYTAKDAEYRFLRNQPENAAAFESLMDAIVSERGFTIDDLAQRLWLASADLAALSGAGHYVGLHSYSHPYEIAPLSPAPQPH